MGAYTTDGQVLSMALENTFTITMSKVAYSMGNQKRPFCMFAEKFQTEHGIVDLMNYGGFDNPNITLKEDIANFMRAKYPTVELTEATIKTLCLYYLMEVSVCYIEIEQWKTIQGERVHSFDKFLCTRNTKLMAEWMGDSSREIEMEGKYDKKLTVTDEDIVSGVVKLVKCNQGAKGNSLTCPRTQYESKTVRCIPLFMLYALQEGIFSTLKDNLLKFEFLKDNNTTRTMVSTLNEDILRKFYDDEFVSMVLGGIDVKTVRQGNMMLSSKAHRGYIKIPEIGSSKYDSTGTRSLNLARLLSIEPVSEDAVDTRFINVDLDSTMNGFQIGLEGLVKTAVTELPKVYNALCEGKGKSFPPTMVPQAYTQECMKEVSFKYGVFSTEYLRWLHLFMVAHPEWFPSYTGQPLHKAGENPPSFDADSYVEKPMEW